MRHLLAICFALTLTSRALAQDVPEESPTEAPNARPDAADAPMDDAPPIDPGESPAADAADTEAPAEDAAVEEAAAEPAGEATPVDEGEAAPVVTSLPDEPPSPEEAAMRTLTTTALPVRPAFTFWRDGDNFIKPVIQISALGVAYLPNSETTDGLAARVSTLAMARFGLEGELFGFLTFRSVFERNLGFSLARNGPVGTSVWEGTASIQARENYLRLSQWGLSLTGGIFPDPASVDFISTNVLDSFGMDPYVRDPLLVSGFAQGQGAMLRYRWEMLDFGLSYTGGNPLTTSLAFGFGGDVSSLGTLFTAPLRALANGIPGSDIQLQTITPSFTISHDIFELRTAAQFYVVDVDVTSAEDAELTGYNLRASAQVHLFDHMLSVFGSFAFRRNQQLAIPDVTMRSTDYEGFVGAGGADFRYEWFGAGAMYYYITSTIDELSTLRNHYINVGLTAWLEDPYVSIGLRWARSMSEATPTPPRIDETDSFILSVRLLI